MMAIEAEFSAIWRPVTQQCVYRRLLMTMSYPGRIADLADLLDDECALHAVLACLVDQAVSIGDPERLVDDVRRRYLAAPVRDPVDADYVVVDGRQPWAANWQPRLGSLRSPDSSTTFLIMVDGLRESGKIDLRGPGIRDGIGLDVEGIDASWWMARREWCGCYPLGVDWILVDETRCACLPRTTQQEGH